MRYAGITDTQPKVAYTMKEVAATLGVGEKTVRHLIQRGDMPAVQISPRRIIIPASSLAGWLVRRAAQDSTQKSREL